MPSILSVTRLRLSLLALLLTAGASTATAQVVSFSTDKNGNTFGCGETITVYAEIDSNFDDLLGFNWILTYDPTVMTPISVDAGPLWGCSTEVFWNNGTTPNGTVDVDVVGLGCSAAGPGKVLAVVFEAQSPGDGNSAGTSSLSLEGRARDSVNATITYSVDDEVSVIYDCNVAPVADDDSATVDEDDAVVIVVLDGDTDVDGTLVPATVTVATAPTNGSATVTTTTGDVTYTPDLDWNGTDTFQYTVEDDDGAASNTATVTVTVNPVNDPPSITDPGAQSSVEGDNVSLQLEATDVDGPGKTWSDTGLPGGLDIDSVSGLISGTIDCGAATDSPYSVEITVDDGAGGIDSIIFDWVVDTVAAPAAIADLVATQVKSGNDADGTTQIALTWSGAGGGNGIKVYRKGFGGYPEYDDSSGVVPVVPASPTAAEGDDWTLISVNASGGADEPVDRDFWYYVAFVENPCGNEVSGPSNLTGGTLNYHLGDVAGGVLDGEGDNAVGTGDVAALGAAYGITPVDAGWKNYLDVGPTTDLGVDARPTTDNVTDFEDLIVLAVNYESVGKSGGSPDPSDRNRITLTVPADAIDDLLEVSLGMEADGRVQGLSLPLSWDPVVVEPVGAFAGELLAAQGRMTQLLTPEPGVIDVAIFGRGERGLSGEGRLATITFRVIGEGDPAIDLGSPTARDATNSSLTLETDRAVGTTQTTEIPQASYLEQNFPNPFNPSTSIRFGLSQDGPVEIRLYSVAGRVVRTLVQEHLPAGPHTVVWDGRDDTGASVASGTYVVRLETTDLTRTLRMTLLR